MGDLWHYYTAEWLSIRIPGSDSHRHRWKVNRWWEVVQEGVTRFGKTYGILRNTQHLYRRDRLMKQAIGCLTTACALDASRTGFDNALLQLQTDVEKWLHSNEMMVDIQKRSAGLGLMDTGAEFYKKKPKNETLSNRP